MEEKHHILYNNLIQFIHLNIDYLRKIEYNEIINGNNKLMKDLYFLICDDEKRLDNLYERDNLMKNIVDEAKKIAGIEKMDLYLTDEELMKQDEEFFREEGKKEYQQQIVYNLYNNGASLDLISKSTNLSIDKINKIIKEQEKMS